MNAFDHDGAGEPTEDQGWDEQGWKDQGWDQADWKGDQKEAAALDLGAFDRFDIHGSWEPLAMCSVTADEDGWIKCNYDTGAAITAFPKAMAPVLDETEGNGDTYKTASGEEVGDYGGLRVTAPTESGRMGRVTGRVADVHKILVAASKAANFGQNGWITRGGGWLIPDDSALSWKIKKLIEKEAQKEKHDMIKLYEERGVYNFYMQTGAQGSKVEAVREGGPAAGQIDVKALSQQAAQQQQQQQKGFQRQP